MERTNFKLGFTITLIISILLTIPRIIRFDRNDVWSLLEQFIYIFILNFIYWYLAQITVAKNRKIIASLFVYLTVTGIFSIIYHFFLYRFFFHFNLINRYLPIFEELNNENLYIILFLRGTLFSGIMYFFVFYLKLNLDKQQNILEIEQLKKEKFEAQLVSLKQQISPHFLFNSLSTLRTMVDEPNSKKFINKLSNVYRYLLNLNENDLVSLKEELDFTQSYLHILKERFEEALIIENNLPIEIENKKIPPLVLQILIENAIKHNIVSIKNPLKIIIDFDNENRIIVTNNIQKKLSLEISTGKGLENIKRRYQILSKQDIAIENNGSIFTVKLPIL